MTNTTIIRISLAGLITVICVAFFLTSFNSATSSVAKPCKESIDECCKKNSEAEAGTEVDFETLSGKFFSSASY